MSYSSCNDIFHNDYIDLQAKLELPKSYEESGNHLFLDGKTYGDTITRQTFDTQFIFDIASAMNTTSCKVYVIDVLSETRHTSKINKVVVVFRLFNTSSYDIKELTKQGYDSSSFLRQGKVRLHLILCSPSSLLSFVYVYVLT
jgi:hypothetical protein